MAAAALSSLSTIVTPSSSSSSTSLSLLPSDPFHSFTNLSPKPSKHLHKTLFLKPTNFNFNFNTTPLPSLFPFQLCHSSSSYSVFGDISGDDELLESEIDESDVEENDDVNSDGGRLFVGNLPFSLTSSQLMEIFSRAGQIKSVELIYDKLTSRSRGFAFVTMESVNEAKAVIRMFDGSKVGGRPIRVNFPEVPKGAKRKMRGTKIWINNHNFVDTPHKIYAGNLAWGVTTKGLRDAFSNQPGFSSARVIYERDSGQSRGFGFVTFQSAEDAQSAITDMNGVELEGRPLLLYMADRNRSNAATATGQSEVLSAVNS